MSYSYLLFVLYPLPPANDESSVNTVKTASPARSLHIDNKILAEHKLNLRKQEKLRADAEQKWMIFSSPDLLDASDVPILNVFMDACMNYVPAAKRKILEESFNQLNLIDEDTGLKPFSLYTAFTMERLMALKSRSDRGAVQAQRYEPRPQQQ